MHKGHRKGIFMTWSDAEKAVKGYSGAIYKKFKSIDDAEHFVKTGEELAKEVSIMCIPPNSKSSSNSKASSSSSYDIQVKELRKEYYAHPHYRKSGIVHNIYADGSTFGNGQPNAVGGYGVFIPCTDLVDEYLLSAPIKGKATNNIGELHGVIKSLEHVLLTDMNLPEEADVSWVINYDSEYAVNAITGRNSSKANLDIVNTGKKLLKMCRQEHIDITFNHIYAHTDAKDINSIGNEVADKLAKARGKLKI